MKKLFFMMFMCLTMALSSCIKHEVDLYDPEPTETEVAENTKKVFGVEFSEDHEWNAIDAASVTVTANAPLDDIVKLQILTKSPLGNGDGNDATILTETEVKEGETVTLYFDVPTGIERLYAACISSSGEYYLRGFNVGETNVSFTYNARTRMAVDPLISAKVAQLDPNPTLAIFDESYAKKRGYAGYENDKLYRMSEAAEAAQMFEVNDLNYSEGLKDDLQDIILTYLPNKVSNIEKIRESSVYNKGSYPITTGTDPIIVEPIYKDDGGYHEVEKCHLYYYYYKDEDIAGMSEDEEIAYLKNLPKFKAVQVSRSVSAGGVSLGMPDKLLRKNTAFALIFWGECKPGNMPGIGSVGSYLFPGKYKIGFMLRNCGKTVHQGELYCDGRLQGGVNSWGHLASSGLGPTDPRMAWLNANRRNFLCCEAGTDRDFNDLVLEIEGGIEPIGIVPPDPKYNAYVMCFEDTKLGDYDMNDVVIKAERIDKLRVRYTLMACGAFDELFLKNLNGSVLNDSREVHDYFGSEPGVFVNTGSLGISAPYVTDVVAVPETFSFTNLEKQVYIYDATTKNTIKLALRGQSPHGIMIPNEFKWPREKVCIKDAYPLFNSWGQDLYLDETNKWYTNYVSDLVMN